MQDLSLHILDIAENSIDAGAKRIKIMIDEDARKNLLTIQIKDNGKGMDKKTLKKVLDPFYTTKTVRRVGLGLSLFAQTIRESDGKIEIKSNPGRGTVVQAKMSYNHIDRKPLGNMCETIISLIGTKGNKIDFVYEHRKDGLCFVINTVEIKKLLDGISIDNPEVLGFLRKKIVSGFKKIKAGI